MFTVIQNWGRESRLNLCEIFSLKKFILLFCVLLCD